MAQKEKEQEKIMICISRKAHFSAAHRLYKNSWSKRKNSSVYGVCSGVDPHGHNYELEVVLKGEPDEETGLLFDLNRLKSVIEKNIIRKLDHQHLNKLEMFKGVVPTGENICRVIWDTLERNLPKNLLFEVKVKETEKNSFFYRKE